MEFHSSTNFNILDSTKLKAFADDKIIATRIFLFVFDWLEKNVGKGENADY